MDVPVEKVRVLVVPHAQGQRRPMPRLVEQHLAALQLPRFPGRQPARPPDEPLGPQHPVVRPKHRPGAPVLRGLEQILRVGHRHIVGVQQQHLLKRAVPDGIGLEFPAAHAPGRMAPHHLRGVDALDIEPFEEPRHPGLKLRLSQMPELRRQPAPQPPERLQAHPGRREIPQPRADRSRARTWPSAIRSGSAG